MAIYTSLRLKFVSRDTHDSACTAIAGIHCTSTTFSKTSSSSSWYDSIVQYRDRSPFLATKKSSPL